MLRTSRFQRLSLQPWLPFPRLPSHAQSLWQESTPCAPLHPLRPLSKASLSLNVQMVFARWYNYSARVVTRKPTLAHHTQHRLSRAPNPGLLLMHHRSRQP